jgi:hypothetical protein
MNIREYIYNEIQNKIQSMIEQHKFNLYQNKVFTYLYRGMESGPYRNLVIPSQWDSVLNGWTYNFQYYNFLERSQENPKPLPIT